MLRKISVDSMKIEGISTLGYHKKVLIFLFVSGGTYILKITKENKSSGKPSRAGQE